MDPDASKRLAVAALMVATRRGAAEVDRMRQRAESAELKAESLRAGCASLAAVLQKHIGPDTRSARLVAELLGNLLQRGDGQQQGNALWRHQQGQQVLKQHCARRQLLHALCCLSSRLQRLAGVQRH